MMGTSEEVNETVFPTPSKITKVLKIDFVYFPACQTSEDDQLEATGQILEYWFRQTRWLLQD